MKKFLSIFAIALMALSSCVTDEPLGPDDPNAGAISLSKTKMEVVARGGDFSVNVYTNYSYEANSNVDWIQIKENEYGPDYTILHFYVGQNLTDSAREGSITVFCDDYNLSATLTIKQDAGTSYGSNQILYTSTDGKIVEPLVNSYGYTTPKDAFGADIVSNTYTNGLGVITFDGDVTGIEYNTFYNSENLESIIIPSKVRSIGSDAFSYCTNLTSITFRDNNELYDIGGGFSNCPALKGFYGSYSSKDNRCLVVNGTIHAFAPAGLSEYSIPEGITGIGWNAFDSSELMSVTIPESVSEIGHGAFINCENLTSVYCYATMIPQIEEYSSIFSYDTSKLKIYVYDEFVEAYKIAWSQYADNIYSNGEHISSTTTIKYTTTDRELLPTNGFSVKSHTYGTLVVYGKITHLSDIFCGNETLESIIIPEGITSIGDWAFEECINLRSVTIPESITSIGEAAFAICHNLEVFYGAHVSYDNRCIILNNTLKAFAPAGLIEYTIPEGVETIGEYTFNYCEALNNIIVPNGVKTIEQGAFAVCTNLASVDLPESLTSIEEYTFAECYNLRYINIPSSLTSIEDGVFCYCTSLAEITIPNSITYIGEYAFDYCTSLTSVTIPNSVTYIGESAFAECSSLTGFYGKFATADNRCLVMNNILRSFAPAGISRYSIPEGITTIDPYAFAECKELTSVTIPESVTSIGDSAFFNSTGLKSVYCKPTTPPTGGHNMFMYYYEEQEDWGTHKRIDCTIYVPQASVDTYKNANNWYEYSDIIKGYNF